ncbi:MAG TPA: translation initiation factor IF-2 [Thermoplasmatales archaeon]|nr:translation initiation factor IF-2 [Thermoplasmatales archaeon]
MENKSYIRQPIVSVLGHVDHGKTTLLDYIRGSTVALREAGAITQHIGATEVPIDVIKELCGDLLKGKDFTLPGLLFIDTPGHHAFTTLRKRGGSIADLAILIVDINEGFKPQTYESLMILKQYKTPFIVAVNKIDSITGWRKEEGILPERLKKQNDLARSIFEEKIYEIIGTLSEHGFSSDLYTNIRDFSRNVAIIPISAKTGEGVPELLMVLVGLAQRFLEKHLTIEKGPAKGTVLEVKEERGLGTTIDVIIYSGTLRSTDTIAVGTREEPVITKIKALLKPKPLDEIRDPREKFESVKEVHAACGIKISAPDLEDVIPGSPLRVVTQENKDEVIKEIKEQTELHIDLDDEGAVVKADTIGSLEAIVKEAKSRNIKIRKAEVGNVSKRDIVDASATNDPLQRVVLAFNVKILPEAEEEIRNQDVMVIKEDVIYTLMERYEEWVYKKREEMERAKKEAIPRPGMIKFLPEYVFRVSKPAIIGVRVLAGRIKPGMKLMKDDGRVIGTIKSIQSEKRSLDEAIQGQEVAVSIEGPTVGRQIKGGDILYTDLPEGVVKKLKEIGDLTYDEKEVLDKIVEIKRKTVDRFWGL